MGSHMFFQKLKYFKRNGIAYEVFKMIGISGDDGGRRRIFEADFSLVFYVHNWGYK